MKESLQSQPLLSNEDDFKQAKKQTNAKKYIAIALFFVIGLLLGILISYLTFSNKRDQFHLQSKITHYQKNQIFSNEQTTNSIDREILSRCFYLSKSAYTGDFSSFYDNINNKSIKFKSGQLMKIIDKNEKNGIFKPVWYLGIHKKEMYVVIRGTNSIFDWISDGSIETYYNGPNSYHKGFYFAAKNIWKDIIISFATYRYLGYKIIFTGHSYGGAVAQILHYFGSLSYKEGVSSYVFGAATSMSENQADEIKNNSYSFVYRDDIVPRLMKYVTYYKMYSKISLSVLDIIKLFANSSLWESTGKELIINPIGSVYHFSLIKNSDAKSVSDNKIINFDDFFDYNAVSALHAINDHDLINYYNNLLYEDGLIPPQDF